MKCGACGNEVALAKVCPYCGSRVPSPDGGAQESQDRVGPKGTFKGAVEDRPKREASSPGGPAFRVLRYFLEPRVPSWQKLLALLAIFYVLSPVDLVPGALFPFAGWLDDIAVLSLAYRWIGNKLSQIDRNS